MHLKTAINKIFFMSVDVVKIARTKSPCSYFFLIYFDVFILIIFNHDFDEEDRKKENFHPCN